MRRLTLLLVLLLVPAAAIARTQSPSADTVRQASGSVQTDTGAADPESAQQVRPVPPPPIPPPVIPRRRGTMVGYIDDAIVGTKIRLRFESGMHNHTPDRAEFFYGKCGCYRDLAGNPNFDPDAPGPGPGIVTNLNFQQLYFQAEYSAGGRVSVFADLPSRWIQPKAFATPETFGNFSGLGDVRAGLKIGLVSASDRVVTAQVKTFFPTGKAENGLGTHHASVEPALLLYNSVNDRVAIESQVGVWLPVGGSQGLTSADKFQGNVFFYGFGPSVEVYRRGELALTPVVELIGWHVMGGLQTTGDPITPNDDASGTNIVNLKIGARISWNARGSVYAGWGHALTTASWYDDIVRFEYRYSF